MEARSQNPYELFLEDVDKLPLLTAVDHEDNGSWQWVDVRIDAVDDVEASEAAANVAQRHGFKFCGMVHEEDSAVIRFNHKSY